MSTLTTSCNFVRWWEGIHHTGDVREAELTESTLREYLCSQSSLQPRPSRSTINDRVAVADRALRNEFPDVPFQAWLYTQLAGKKNPKN